MNNIKNLTKIYLLESLGSMFNKNKGKKTKKVSLLLKLLLMIPLSLFIMSSLYFLFYGYYLSLKPVNLEKYVLIIALTINTLVSIMFLSYQTQTLFYKPKDYTILSSLPIPEKHIITSKILTLTLSSYIYQLIVLIPAITVYFIFVQFSATLLLYFVLGFLFIPAFTMLFTAISTTLINAISSKTINKDKTNSMLLLLFSLILAFVYVYISNFGINQIIKIGKIPGFLNYVFPANTSLFKAISNNNFFQFILSMIINLVYFVLSIIIFSKSYLKINQRLQNNTIKNNHKKTISYKSTSTLKNLIILELKTFFSYPVYIINSAFGTIILTILSIATPIFYFTNTTKIHDMLQTFTTALEISQHKLILLFFIAIPLFTLLLSNTTSSSVSIEGKSHYFKKSLPLKFSDIVLSKVLVNIIIALPYLLFLATTLPIMIILKLTIIDIIFTVITPILFLLFSSQIGLLLNLWIPKLDWTNETMVVKQSMPVFISVMFNMILPTVFVYVFLQSNISNHLFFIITTLLLTVLNFIMWKINNTVGKKLYVNIS